MLKRGDPRWTPIIVTLCVIAMALVYVFAPSEWPASMAERLWSPW